MASLCAILIIHKRPSDPGSPKGRVFGEMKLFGLLAALACVAVSTAQPATRPDPVSPEVRAAAEAPALEWLKGNVVPFAVDVPTQAELKPLMESLQGARVIGFGEATHGDQQSQLFKTHAIRELFRLGQIDSLMLEVNRRPGAELDAYVNEGKGDLAQLMLESGIFSIWRTDEFASLIVWLRAYVTRTGKSIRIYGIDCQEPGLDFKFALDWLEKADKETAQKISTILQPMVGAEIESAHYFTWVKTQTKDDYARYHNAGNSLVAEIKKHTNTPGQEEALYAAQVGVQGLETYELEFTKADVVPTMDNIVYFARRDVFMGANLLRRLGGGKAALWAHDMHTVGEIPEAIQQFGFRTVGGEVRRALKEEYVAIGFAWATGSFRARLFSATDQVVDAAERPFEIFALSNMRPGDLGEFFSRVGPHRWYADFRKANEPTKAWGKLLYYRGWCGWGVDPKAWMSNPMQDAGPPFPTHDILVFHHTIGPSTTWMLPAHPSRSN